MEGWMSVVGYILIALGFVFLQVDSYQQGYKKALDDVLEMIENRVKEDKHLVAFSGSPNGTANFIDYLNAHHF